MAPRDRYTVQTIMGNRVRYVVPSFYQRAYVWTLEKQWSELWADLRRKTIELAGAKAKVESDPYFQPRIANHFMGAFVVSAAPAFGFFPPRKDVIDGQQRLTTIQLLLNAFRHVVAQLFGPADQIVSELDTLTHNTNASGEYEYKVWPTEADQDLFGKIMSRSRDDLLQKAGIGPHKPGRQAKQKGNGIDGAYSFFYEEILTFLSKNDSASPLDASASRAKACDLYEVIVQRMDLVMIELDDNDDPQVIFEALNGRGTPLLPSDLIKNHLFEKVRPLCPGGDPMPLYQEYWREFDTLEDDIEEDDEGKHQKFWKVDVRQGRLYRPRIDLFLFHYLQYRRGREVPISELFREFKDWWSQQPNGDLQATKTNLQDVRRHADVFRSLLTASDGSETADRLWHLRAVDTSTIYPVLLFLLSESQVNPRRVEKNSLHQLLIDLESFLVRRAVCGLTSKNYNNIFMKLLADLQRLDSVDPYAVGRLLRAGDDPTNYFPKDEEFKRCWVFRPIYAPSTAGFINMLLAAINERMRTDAQEEASINYQSLWVEHIMPRKWQAKWLLPNAEAEHHRDTISGVAITNREWRDTLVHTMGNLTLLTAKLNERISNGPFLNAEAETDKKREYEKHVILRVTRDFVHDRETWDESAILDRANKLFIDAVAIWPYSGLP